MSLKLKTSFAALAISAAASGALAGEHDTHNDREVLSEAYTNETELPNFVCWRKNQQGENIALFTSSIFPKGLDLDGYLTSDKYVAYPERVITKQAEMSVPTVSKSSLDFALGEAEEKPSKKLLPIFLALISAPFSKL